LLDRLRAGQGPGDLPCVGHKHGNEIVLPRQRAEARDLAALPEPAWDLIPVESYLKVPFPFMSLKRRTLTSLTSRGCLNNCVFCTGKKGLGGWRPRPLESLRTEWQRLKSRYGVEEIQLVDANVNADPDRFRQICRMFKEERLSWNPLGGLYLKNMTAELAREMVRSGSYYFPLGIEHGADRIQRHIGKIVPLEKVREVAGAIRSEGGWTNGSFILGFPDETPEDVKDCIRYAQNCGVDSISVFTATPLPGSRMEAALEGGSAAFEMRLLGDESFCKAIGKKGLRYWRRRMMSDFVRRRITLAVRRPFFHLRGLLAHGAKRLRILIMAGMRFVKLYAGVSP
jgi:radical SAM superfamily enzyme YgiQ (UPF0313 family)